MLVGGGSVRETVMSTCTSNEPGSSEVREMENWEMVLDGTGSDPSVRM